MKLLLKITAIVLSSLVLHSCNKDVINDNQLITSKRTTIDTRAYDKWIYFSFKNGVVSSSNNSKEDPNWDLAFHRWDVKTNGGLSGLGKGGAYITSSSSLNIESISINQSNIIKDGLIKTYMSTPDMNLGPEQKVEVSANGDLCKWMTVTMSSIPPLYSMSDKVFIVRTSSGDYAAIKFISYMDDKATKGIITFEYLYPIK